MPWGQSMVECTKIPAKTTVMFFSVLNENQALSVGPIEHFVKLHSQISSWLNFFFFFREYFISFCNQTHVDKTLHI